MWQPIETAPKDGTQIILARFVGSTNFIQLSDGWIMVGSWNGSMFTCMMGILSNEVSVVSEMKCDWTHWAQLPEPPQ